MPSESVRNVHTEENRDSTGKEMTMIQGVVFGKMNDPFNSAASKATEP